MALTAEDLRDLVALLQAHPEWRKVLWALLASEEVLRMPTGLADLRDELARLQAETERRFMELAEAVRRLSEAFVNHRQEFLAHQAQVNARFAELSAEVRALVEAQRRMEESLQRLAEAQRRTEESLQRLAEAFVAHRQEFIAHRQEFLAHREETNRRFAELAEAQRRTEESLQRLAEAFAAHRQEFIAHRQEFLEFRAETNRRFAELAEALRILTERVDRVEARLDRVEVRLDRVERRQEDHSRDLGELKSMRLEALYAEKPAVLFRSLLRRAAIVPDARQAEILEEAVAAGRITMEEADRAAPLDALVEGFHRREDRRMYLAVEISWQGTTKDVARAAERAAVFARALGAEVIPVVAAKELTVPARRMARARGVWWLQDGRAFAPQEIPEEGPGEDDVETPT
jgi:chromosome segregation ATPase